MHGAVRQRFRENMLGYGLGRGGFAGAGGGDGFAVTAGGLVILTRETPEVFHPSPFARAGETVVVPRTRIRIEEGKGRRLVVLPAKATLRELVNRLNALGLGSRDLIGVLQAIKASGALQAEIMVR